MAPRRKPRRPQKPYCLLPSLHDDVSTRLMEDDLVFGFNGQDNPDGCLKELDTTFSGRFVCRNDACRRKGKSWHSAKIAIAIRIYRNCDYNARLYKQRCKHCNGLGDLVLDRRGSYADTVANQIKE